MIAVNAAAQLAALGSSLLIQTVYVVVIARTLGVEEFGRFSLVLAISQILLLSGDLGLHNTALRRIASRPREWEDFFNRFFALKAGLSLVLFALMTLAGLSLGQGAAAAWCAFLFGVGLVFHSSSLSINVAFQARGMLYLASINSLFLIALQFIVGVAALSLGGRLVWIGFAYLVACAGAFLVNWGVFRRVAFPIRLKSPRDWRSLLKTSLPVGVSSFFETAASRIAVTLLAYLSGTFETGIYAAAGRITGALRNIPTAVLSAVLPVMAAYPDRTSALSRLFRQSVLWMLVLSIPLAAALFFLAEPLIGFVFGPDYSAAAGVLRILAWSLVPLFVGLAFSHLVLSQGRLVRSLPWVTGGVLLFNVLCNLALISRMGSRGAGFSQLLTEVLAALLFGAVALKFLRAR